MKELSKQLNLDSVIETLKNTKIELENLTETQLKEIVSMTIKDSLSKDLQKKIELSKINYQEEKEIFIKNVSTSYNTSRSYRNSLLKLEEYTRKYNIDILDLTPKQADDFIYSLSILNLSNSTCRAVVNACSSFFSFLERRFNSIQNPFRGTKARPKKKTNINYYPSKEEKEIIIQALPQKLSLIVDIITRYGFRSDFFPGLELSENEYKSISKSKEIRGVFDNETVKKIRNFSTNKKPFSMLTPGAIQQETRYHITKLYNQGKIQHIYSIHDFRHFFAISFYKETKDIYTLSKKLNHSSISITETYLKGLNVF